MTYVRCLTNEQREPSAFSEWRLSSADMHPGMPSKSRLAGVGIRIQVRPDWFYRCMLCRQRHDWPDSLGHLSFRHRNQIYVHYHTMHWYWELSHGREVLVGEVPDPRPAWHLDGD